MLRRFPLCVKITFPIVAWASLISMSAGQLAPSSGEQASNSIVELIQDLGAASYEKRELATVLLTRAGDDAVPLLQAISSGAQPEVRLRAAKVLEGIQAASFDVKASKFLREADPSLSYGLPAWEPFRQLVGDSRVSKLLFVDAVRCQRRLLQILDVYHSAEQDERPVLGRAVDALATVTAQQVQQKQLNASALELGDFVALLVAASLADGQAPVIVNEAIETNIHRYEFTSRLRQQGYSTCLRRLLAHWVPKSHDALAGQVMQIALMYELKSGATVARRHLKAKSEIQVRSIALQCISQFGNAVDIPSVVKLLNDETVIFSLLSDDMDGGDDGIDVSYSAPPGFESTPMPKERKRYVVQVNDLALVAAIRLSGGEPAEYFPEIRQVPGFGIDTRSIATLDSSPDQREKRLKAWMTRYSESKATANGEG